MPAKAIVSVAIAALSAITLLVGSPPARAKVPWDRVNITCTSGEEVTWGPKAHRADALVLGCADLAGDRRLQLGAHHSAGHPRVNCFGVTHKPPPHSSGMCVPLRSGGPGSPRVLLMARYRSTLPILVIGLASPRAEQVAAEYSTVDGARAEVGAQLIRVDGELAQRLGAPHGFVAFVAELGPGADACRGITPRAVDTRGRRLKGRRAVVTPEGSFGLPHDGWVAGFTRTWGWGSGGQTPSVCGETSRLERRDVRSEPRSAPDLVALALERVAQFMRELLS